LISRRPPCASIFPYTTLFRSRLMEQMAILKEKERARSQIIDAQQCEIAELKERLDTSSKILYDYKEKWHRTIDAWEKARDEAVQDRKSTRLNSSHEWISYAVF